MNKFLTIDEGADLLGVSPQTLRRWEKAGKITCAHRTEGNQRRYDIALLKTKKNSLRCRQKVGQKNERNKKLFVLKPFFC